MVVGERFAWAHIPKTGGDATHAYFAAVPGLCQVLDDVRDATKHDTFAFRGVVREHYLLTHRSLPAWCLSMLHECLVHPHCLCEHGWVTPGDVLRPENALRLRADAWLEHYTLGVTIHRWFRCDRLLPDLIDYLGSIGWPLTRSDRVRMAGAVVKPRREYDHDVGRFFTPEQIDALYAANPVWAAVERACRVAT